MDYSRMLRSHQERGAAATLAAIEETVEDASRFGIVAINEDERITGFQEKPAKPIPIPGSPDLALASMGVYIFDTDVLVRALEADANLPTSHDFGKDIIPALIHQSGSCNRLLTRTTAVLILASARSTRSKPAWICHESDFTMIRAAATYQPQAPPAVRVRGIRAPVRDLDW
jgi:NDP-sugar pyrophosphorylase family protein